MEILTFSEGDTVWFHNGRTDGKMTKGKVLEILDLTRHGYSGPLAIHYVIEVQTHIDPYLEVRDGLTLSDHPKKPIGFHRRGNHKPVWEHEDV